MKLRSKLFFCVACLFAGVNTSAETIPESSTAIPDYPLLLNQRLSEIGSLRGEFEQITEGAFRSSNITYKGQLWIGRPYQFRVETTVPSAQSLVSDGQDFWSYDEDLEQVVISHLNKDLGEVPILLFSSNMESIEAAYSISGYSDEGYDYFLLEPGSDISLFRSLLIEFKGQVPASIRINAATGEQSIISLNHVVLNEKLHEDRFRFSVPDGADIIDER
jgi:outer membrane lipoprotein carrier protein